MDKARRTFLGAVTDAFDALPVQHLDHDSGVRLDQLRDGLNLEQADFALALDEFKRGAFSHPFLHRLDHVGPLFDARLLEGGLDFGHQLLIHGRTT